jgi:hypothetical protein
MASLKFSGFRSGFPIAVEFERKVNWEKSSNGSGRPSKTCRHDFFGKKQLIKKKTVGVKVEPEHRHVVDLAKMGEN